MMGCSDFQLLPQIVVFYRLEGTKGGPPENKFCPFSNTKMNITVRAGKADEENGAIRLVSIFLS